MAELPNKENLFAPELSGLDALTLMENWYDVTTQLPGASPSSTLFIEDDSINPSVAFNFVDTEGQAPQDDLYVINIERANDGMFLYLQAASEDRTINIKESQSEDGIKLHGAGQKVLHADYPLILRREGQRWIEIGKEITPIVNSAESGLFPKLTGNVGHIPIIQVEGEEKLITFKDPSDVILSTPDLIPNQIIQRDDYGQAKVGIPTDNEHIARLADVKVETWQSSDGSSFYRKCPDGWIVQGGIVLRNNIDFLDTLSLMHPFKDTNYRIWFADYPITDITDTVYWYRLVIFPDTNTTFKARRAQNFDKGWVACGWGD